MAKGELVCAETERLPTGGGFGMRVVLGVANNGTIHMCKLDADLVMSSGV